MNTFNNKNKKGQMEIIGLVVIVILISLGMLFMTIFALEEKPDKKVFTRKGLAYSTMGTLMKTTIKEECGYVQSNLQLEQNIIEDCANYVDLDYSEYSCNSMHSCLFLNQTITELLNSTLGKWNKRYEFYIKLNQFDNNLLLVSIMSKRGGCKGERDSSGLFPLQTESGLVESVLYICD